MLYENFYCMIFTVWSHFVAFVFIVWLSIQDIVLSDIPLSAIILSD